jgi:3-hydroxybutyryl-CoA dehydrogenase
MNGALGILGPGTLGLSLAQWAAERGLDVRLLGRDPAHGLRGAQNLRERWQTLVARGKLTPEAAGTLDARVSGHGWEGLQGCATLLEATPEDPGIKSRIWREVAETLDPGTLCLTGSSALPVGPLAAAAGLPGRLVGFHLFVPVRSMRVVELVLPEGTPSPWEDRAESFANQLGLRIARVKDGVGYAAARMSLALGLEAMRLLEEGVATAEDLDALMRMGYGHPVGPLDLSDRVGLDLRLTIADRLREVHGERFQAPDSLRALVAQGKVGRKSKGGFYPGEGEP